MQRKRAKRLVSQPRTSVSVKTSEIRHPHHDDEKNALFTIQLYGCCSNFNIMEYRSWLLHFPNFLVEFGRVKLPFRNSLPSITGSLNVLWSNSWFNCDKLRGAESNRLLHSPSSVKWLEFIPPVAVLKEGSESEACSLPKEVVPSFKEKLSLIFISPNSTYTF